VRPTELLAQSMRALAANRLRSALTLLGIVAGVASIIAVMTALALVQATLEREMSVLGSQTFQAQKWPAGGFASDAQRRRAMRRQVARRPRPRRVVDVPQRQPDRVRTEGGDAGAQRVVQVGPREAPVEEVHVVPGVARDGGGVRRPERRDRIGQTRLIGRDD